ncbi:MAG TPA: hypothetical protein VFC63_03880, partial [Blastocatellia bacterium]|nr:hypothetical protein [Blastocatellia bacterium]
MRKIVSAFMATLLYVTMINSAFGQDTSGHKVTKTITNVAPAATDGSKNDDKKSDDKKADDKKNDGSAKSDSGSKTGGSLEQQMTLLNEKVSKL